MIDKKIICEESQLIKRARTIRRIFNTVVCIIIVPILIITTTMFIQYLNNPKGIPSFLGYKFFIILTGSMEHTLNRGDFIVIRETSENELKKGDIITFNIENAEVTHRIIKIEEKNEKTQYITKGDNNNTEDSMPVTIDKVKGKYVFKIPVIGKIVSFFQKPIGLAALVVIGVTMGLVNVYINRYIEEKRIIRKTKRLEYDKKELKK